MSELKTDTLTQEKKVEEANNIYDVIIIGSGMAGMTAAIYAARAELKTIIIEPKLPGGQITTTEIVENWPTHESITGVDIGQILKKQIDNFNVKSEWAQVTKINKLENIFVISTSTDKTFTGKSVVIATGTDPRKLGVPGETEFIGRGVSYCATCDGAFYKNKNVVVVGGGDAAVKEALYLAKIVNKVTIVHRRDQLRAEKVIARKAASHEKIEILWHTVAEEILGGGNNVTGLNIKNVQTDEKELLFCDGVFIYVGNNPNVELVKDLVDLTETGFIAAGEDTKTSLPGLFAAGDVRVKPLRQLTTAAADGAVAATMAEQYIETIH